MRGRWFGRRMVFWIADAVLIPLFLVLGVLVEDTGMRVVAGLLVLSRIMTIGVLLAGARRHDRGAVDAGRDGAAPPR